jgi:hypothetical protein
MRQSGLMSIYDHWNHPSYEIRIRGTAQPTYLWGSAGITKIMPFDKAPVLHLRNDLFGEQVTLGTQSGATQTALGTLHPGECISIPLQNLSGVYATCTLESTVACVIKGST